MDADPIGIPVNKLSNGSAGGRSVCFTPDKTTPMPLQLEAGSGGRGNRWFHAELGSNSGVCQPSMVSDTSLPDQTEKANSTNGADNTIVEDPTVVPLTTGASRGLTPEDTSPTRSSEARIFDGTRSATTSCLAYLRGNLIITRLFSAGFRPHSASWRDKTNSNYGSSFSSGLASSSSALSNISTSGLTASCQNCCSLLAAALSAVLAAGGTFAVTTGSILAHLIQQELGVPCPFTFATLTLLSSLDPKVASKNSDAASDCVRSGICVSSHSSDSLSVAGPSSSSYTLVSFRREVIAG